jgi:HNH endonuclease
MDDHQAHVSQQLTMQPNLDESVWKLWGQLDGYGGSVVNKVLTEEADLIGSLPDGERPGLGYRRAMALVKKCEETGGTASSTPLITVFVDSEGVQVEAGTPVGPEIVDKVACVGSLELIKTVDGKPLSIGRRSRVISRRLRRFVLHRDGGCTADGCTSRYRLEAHHKIPWSQGGPTDADNLIIFCWFHHHVVIHGWGYRIDARLGPGRIHFTKPGHDPP